MWWTYFVPEILSRFPEWRFDMKTGRVLNNNESFLVIVLTLTFLLTAAISGAAASLEDRVVSAARAGDCGRVKTLQDNDTDINSKDVGVKIAITKFFFAAVVLLFIFVFSKSEPDDSNVFPRQKWTLRDAYKAVVYSLCMIFCFILMSLWLGPPTPEQARLNWVLVCGWFLSFYHNYIGRPYRVKLVDFGVDKAHFLGSGVFALNVAGGYYLLSAAGITIPPLDSVFRAASPPVSSTLDAGLYGFVLAFCEELLFRGVLYAPVARGAGRGTAIVGLALAECLIHTRLDAEQTIVMLLVFAAFYLVYSMTESLLGPVILHIGINVPVWQPAAMAATAGYFPASAATALSIGIPLIALLVVDGWWLLNRQARRKPDLN